MLKNVTYSLQEQDLDLSDSELPTSRARADIIELRDAIAE